MKSRAVSRVLTAGVVVLAIFLSACGGEAGAGGATGANPVAHSSPSTVASDPGTNMSSVPSNPSNPFSAPPTDSATSSSTPSPASSSSSYAPAVQPSAPSTATLTWDPPTQNTDGSALTNLAGYTIYYGTASGNYTHSIQLTNPGLAAYVIDGLVAGTTYYFAIAATTNTGLMSALSSEVSTVIQ